MNVSVIGGGGLVGSCAAFALQCGGIVSGIDLIDVNADLCKGQALDLLHGASLVADQRIRATGYEAIPESDLVMITAGLRRKPDESRLDLINRNTDLFLGILAEINKVGYKQTAIAFVVSNPVDILTYVAADRLKKLPPAQVIGLGTQLDTIRFRSLIAQQLKVAPTQVNALILGEHGDSMVPIWSSAAIAGSAPEASTVCTPHAPSSAPISRRFVSLSSTTSARRPSNDPSRRNAVGVISVVPASNVMWNVLPSPGTPVLSAHAEPPISSARRRLIARPSPVPP